MVMMMAKICSQKRLNPLHIKSWRAGGQSSYWHFCYHIMTEDRPPIRSVPSEMDCQSRVSLCCGSWWCDLYAWLCLQTVAPGCCLSLCSTVWKKKEKVGRPSLCEERGKNVSSVSRLSRGYHVLCGKLLELLQNLSSSSFNDRTKPQNICIFLISSSYNLSSQKGIVSSAAQTQSQILGPHQIHHWKSASALLHLRGPECPDVEIYEPNVCKSDEQKDMTDWWCSMMPVFNGQKKKNTTCIMHTKDV